MKRPWAFICASEGATAKHLRNYCREVYLLGYLPICPKLQDGQYLMLEDPIERSEYAAIVRDKLLRCPMLVVCSRNQDATTNAQIGLAQKYNRICAALSWAKKFIRAPARTTRNWCARWLAFAIMPTSWPTAPTAPAWLGSKAWMR